MFIFQIQSKAKSCYTVICESFGVNYFLKLKANPRELNFFCGNGGFQTIKKITFFAILFFANEKSVIFFIVTYSQSYLSTID